MRDGDKAYSCSSTLSITTYKHITSRFLAKLSISLVTLLNMLSETTEMIKPMHNTSQNDVFLRVKCKKCQNMLNFKHITSMFLAGLSISLVPSDLICLKSMNNCTVGSLLFVWANRNDPFFRNRFHLPAKLRTSFDRKVTTPTSHTLNIFSCKRINV